MKIALLATSAILTASPAWSQTASSPTADAPATATGSATRAAPAAATADSAIVVTGRRLDRARDALLPSLGANKYTLDRSTIATQPGGDDLSFQRVLLQTPGVSQDNFGQVHVRNEHANLQYRLNGVILPEPISGFGQVLDTRIADSVSLITGALPAQYGYRTAGVVDIKTQTGAFKNSGSVSLYGGSYDTIRPSATAQGSTGGFNAFGSFTYGRTNLGIDNPIGSVDTFNNRSETYRGFFYASQILSETTRVSAILGLYDGSFEIPARPGQTPSYTYKGIGTFDSSKLNEYQTEKDYYGTIPVQYSNGDLNFQIAPFFRLSRTRFKPDVTGDLLFNGIADRVRLSSDLFGVQADGSYKASGAHTLRFGVFYQREITRSNVDSLVFELDPDPNSPTFGQQTSDQPTPIADAGRKLGTLIGVYAQDEWTPLPKLTVNFGGRFDRVEAFTHEQQFSPRVNAVYKFSNALAAHMGYARNFTPPPQELIAASLVMLYDGTTKAALSSANDAVLAERETLYDAGVNATLFAHFMLTVDAYYKHKRNLIDEGQFGEALVLGVFNYRRGYNYGIEVGGNYRRGPLSVYANVAAAEQRGNEIVSSQFFFQQNRLNYIAAHYIYTDHTQKLTGSAGASYRIDDPLGPLTASADLIYGSGLRRNPPDGSLIPNGSKLPAYEQVNVGLSQQIASHGPLQGVELRVDIINLADATYQIRDGTGVGISAPQFGQRRSFYGGVAKRF